MTPDEFTLGLIHGGSTNIVDDTAHAVYVDDVEELIGSADDIASSIDELRARLHVITTLPTRQYANHLLVAAESTINALTALLRIEAQS